MIGAEMIAQEKIKELLPFALRATDLPLPGRGAGKVREWYDLAGDSRLIVTTDRLSAFDRVLASVPYKGQVLNQLSAWWFAETADILPNHLVSVPDPNASIVKRVRPIPVEVIVRGFITGVTSTALWHRYELGERQIYGYTFPDGLRKNERLAQPIITPTTKADGGAHDERLTPAEVVESGILDSDRWGQIQAAALAIFQRGQEIAARSGLILVDTKYEFGIGADEQIMLIDEVHTPDSSRFWKSEGYQARFEAGEEPEYFDKEFVRLAYIEKGYRGDGDPPSMPEELWAAAAERYIAIYRMLTRRPFEPAEYPVEPRLRRSLTELGL